jgi:hypothetical protein
VLIGRGTAMPGAALLGGVLVLADLLARAILAPTETGWHHYRVCWRTVLSVAATAGATQYRL